jgi:hypothetical protein
MPEQLPILQRREIEARVLAPVYRILERELGPDKAKSVLSEAIEADAVAAGQALAEGVPPAQRLRAFIAAQSLWTAGDALVEEVHTATDTDFEFTVTRCAYAELYERLGIRDLGYILSCHRDASFIKGVDPEIEFSREGTIMLGEPACHFRYRLAR